MSLLRILSLSPPPPPFSLSLILSLSLSLFPLSLSLERKEGREGENLSVVGIVVLSPILFFAIHYIAAMQLGCYYPYYQSQ